MTARWNTLSNGLLSLLAGIAAFLFTLAGFMLLGEIDHQVVASLFIGLFALMVVRMAAERPNEGQARATGALIERLLDVRHGDLSSPAPAVLRSEMPALASAVDGLFEQVRSSLDNFRTMAMYDPVTSLPNRIHFRREAERILAARQEGGCTAVLFIDLDGFKEVNDRFGHAEGDQMLTMVANRLRVVVKAESNPDATPPLLARLAGDEFTILLPKVASGAEAERVGGSVLAALAQPFSGGATIGASIGIALCPQHGTELPGLMKAADTAMYHAKLSGRARVCLYDDDVARHAESRAGLALAMSNAVAQSELALLYQPRLCLRTGAILAADAALCWKRQDAEPLWTGELLAAAEEAGLEHRVSATMLASALGAYGRWQQAGLSQRLCVRLSSGQLERGDFAERFFAALAGAARPRGSLELEIPAAALDRIPGHVRDQLAALRQLGVSISIGGFGAAGMDLSALRSVPADRIKLDPALTAEIDHDERACTIFSALLHLIHGLGCEAVAMGVHREDQVVVLRAAGCDAVQGFFAADPMEEEAFVAWIAAQDCAQSLARAS